MTFLFQTDLAFAAVRIEFRIREIVYRDCPKTLRLGIPDSETATSPFPGIPLSIFQQRNWDCAGAWQTSPSFENVLACGATLGRR